MNDEVTRGLYLVREKKNQRLTVVEVEDVETVAGSKLYVYYTGCDQSSSVEELLKDFEVIRRITE